MRHIMIDFNASPIEAGYLGEHNATEIVVVKPVDISGAMYSVAFMTNGEVIHSRFFGADEEIRVELWQQLTQDNDLYVQLEAYDENGDYLGKSATIKLLLLNSVHGIDIIADADNPDVYSEIALNSLFRETLEDNADTLDKLTTSANGMLLFNGRPIQGSGEGGGFSPIVEIESIEGGHRVTITDIDGEKTFDVLDGNDYVLTETDKTEIAELTAGIIDTSLLNAIGSGVLE